MGRFPPVPPICVRVSDAVKLTGIGRSRLYEFMGSGDLPFLKVGRSTLIRYADLQQFIEARARPVSTDR